MSLLPEIEITENHVGAKVTHIDGSKGIIRGFNSLNYWPVEVIWEGINGIATYRGDGTWGGIRCIFIGHNVKICVEEESLPKPKLICPVCGVEHGIEENKFNQYEFTEIQLSCPLLQAVYTSRGHAELAMKNLIKAFKEK